MGRRLISIAFLMLFQACSGTPEPEAIEATNATNPTPPSSDEGVDMELTPEQLATLDAADLLDSQQDKIVEKCGRCALAMDGDETHASHVGEYELHFCSDSCKASFEADPAKGIAEMQANLDQ